MMYLMVCNQIHAQNPVTYGYDASGNRISRVVIFAAQAPKAEITAEEKVYGETLKDFTVRIYPNPTKGELTVEIQQLPEGETATLWLYSMSGSLISRKTGVSDIEHFNISRQPAGIYLLKIKVGDSSTEWKIIKQ